MTNPIPDEAVEAAFGAFLDSFCDDEAGRIEPVSALDGTTGYAMTGGNDARAVFAKALTAAAPHIAAQAAKHERGRTATAIARLIRARANATLDDRERLSGNISAGYALVFAGIWHKNALLSDDPVAAECDRLRAGIEALRDEFRSNIDWSDGRNNYGDNEAWESAADALDALLREGE